MTPVVYQNRNGTESLWAYQTDLPEFSERADCCSLVSIQCYWRRFHATPVQQQSWNNGDDGLWRWMPSIAVDKNGNMAIGYSISSPACSPLSVMLGVSPRPTK